MLFIVKSYPLSAVAVKTLQQASISADSANAVVLVDDGVYYTQQTNTQQTGLGLLSGLANTLNTGEAMHSATSLFALQDDMALRGLFHKASLTPTHEASSEDNTESVTPISMDKFVALTDTFYPAVLL
ncbi:DsrH/TusB family sulfur relay protein [Alteromonas stellipolaris]|uniref:DsrH/TusB family sulfur relay protein n=1 Tax=Alteromonas stellipolaris TaxID=233316 RepID=UPI0021191B7B|nr:DsrH/TusB family sulfur relay protein [Alteromonas stellipolaris]MCQ8850213.1 DsrH/TusB family sulfur relay protein [Alteromonas stellipolaris]